VHILHIFKRYGVNNFIAMVITASGLTTTSKTAFQRHVLHLATSR
jgi:hypothetical protein